jgi:hypothetical protein
LFDDAKKLFVRARESYLAGALLRPVSAGIGFTERGPPVPGEATLFQPAKGFDPRNRSLFED